MLLSARDVRHLGCAGREVTIVPEQKLHAHLVKLAVTVKLHVPDPTSPAVNPEAVCQMLQRHFAAKSPRPLWDSVVSVHVKVLDEETLEDRIARLERLADLR